jgi:hypothetical protein
MKSKLRLFGVLAVLVVAASVLLIVPATGSSSNGAFQVSDLTCNLIDGNGTFFQVNSPTKQVSAPDGSWNITCKAKGAPNDTGSAVIWNFDNTGLPCIDLTVDAITYDYSETVSKNGNVSLTCHFDATVPV